MRINCCIPTRNKNRYVVEFVNETARRARLPDTKIVLGYDDDDWQLQGVPLKFGPRNIDMSIAPREDSLGAKYNRCARHYDADLYVMCVDDVSISTPGWDERLAEAASLFKDGIGYLYFGTEKNGEFLPPMMAVTRRVVDLVGFCPEYFPFWFNNMWNHEVAAAIGGIGQRIVGVPIEVRYPEGAMHEPPRRDVNFWAQFFDNSRPLRVAQAARLIEAMDDGPTAKAMLKAMMMPRLKQAATLNTLLRDPSFAESMVRVEDALDARHERLKAQARKTVDLLNQKAA